MRRSFLPIIAATISVLACSDRQSPTQPSALAPVSPQPQEVSFTGTIMRNPESSRAAPYVLATMDGGVVALQGDQTSLLEPLVDAQAYMHGYLNDVGVLNVDEFIILAVRGSAVSDGVLEINEDFSYDLKLTVSGDRRAVIDPSDDLKALLGDRIWLAENAETPNTFGVIDGFARGFESLYLRHHRVRTTALGGI